jgi:hypothetical protein
LHNLISSQISQGFRIWVWALHEESTYPYCWKRVFRTQQASIGGEGRSLCLILMISSFWTLSPCEFVVNHLRARSTLNFYVYPPRNFRHFATILFLHIHFDEKHKASLFSYQAWWSWTNNEKKVGLTSKSDKYSKRSTFAGTMTPLAFSQWLENWESRNRHYSESRVSSPWFFRATVTVGHRRQNDAFFDFRSFDSRSPTSSRLWRSSVSMLRIRSLRQRTVSSMIRSWK